MDIKEAERRFKSSICTGHDMEEFKKAAMLKVTMEAFKELMDGTKMLSTEASVLHHFEAVKIALIFVCASLTTEQSCRLVEIFRPKMKFFERFDPHKREEYQQAILKLVSSASNGYLLVINEKAEGSEK